MSLVKIRGFRARVVAAALLCLSSSFGIGAVPAARAAEADSGQPLTLEQAIEHALEKNENIVIQRAALDSAEASVEGAHGAYDPQLTVGAGWEKVTSPVNSSFSGAPAGELAPSDRTGQANASLDQLLPTGAQLSVTSSSSRVTTNGAFVFLSPAYQTQLGVEVRQPLLRDRAIDSARYGLRVAAADRDQAQAALRRQVTETVAAVEQAYWSLVAARRAVDVEQEAIDLAEKQLSETRIRIDAGTSPETEIAQPQAELERRRGDLLAAREAAARAETALKRLILGAQDDLWAERLDPVDTPEIPVEPVDVQAAMTRALASRPELDAAKATVERRRAESAFAKNRILPSLDLVASYDRFGLKGSRNPSGSSFPGLPSDVPQGLEGNLGDAVGQLASSDYDDARLSLQLQVPLGNRAARANARIAADTERQAEADVAGTQKAIRAEVLDAAAAVETAAGRIDAARAERKAAQVQLSAEQDRFSAGLSTNFLVLTRQNDLASARLSEIQALTDYRAALAEMARATGSLLDERHVEIQPSPK